MALQNQLRAELERSWPGRRSALRRRRLADRAGLPDPLPPPRRRPRARPASALASLPAPATPTAAGAPPAQLLERLPGPRHGRARRPTRPRPAAPSCWAWSPPCGRSSAQIRQLDREIAGALERPSRRPRSSARCFRDPKPLTAAELLAEIGDSRARYPNAEALAADAGQTPVAIESGKRRGAAFRCACDKRLRSARRRARRQQPPPEPLGRRHLPPRPPTRLRPPPRHPHPRPRLDPRPLALLARPQPYDPTRHARPPAPPQHRVDTGRLIAASRPATIPHCGSGSNRRRRVLREPNDAAIQAKAAPIRPRWWRPARRGR